MQVTILFRFICFDSFLFKLRINFDTVLFITEGVFNGVGLTDLDTYTIKFFVFIENFCINVIPIAQPL